MASSSEEYELETSKEEGSSVVIHGGGYGGDLEAVKESNSLEKFVLHSISGFGNDEQSVKQGWRLVPEERKKKIEGKFKALQAKEFDLVKLRTELLHEVTSKISEASKKSSK